MTQDVETLKLDRESKFKVKQLTFDTSSGGQIEDAIKKELMNLRVQHESLFEKTQLNSDKLVALEVELYNQKRNDKLGDNGNGNGPQSPFAEDIKGQYAQLTAGYLRCRRKSARSEKTW